MRIIGGSSIELQLLVKNHALARGLSPADVYSAQHRHQTAAIFAVEGGDFIEDKLDRVHEAFRDGVRAITIVHYHVNQIGDIQTEAPVHGGLTAFGKSVIREMNRTGIIVDLAHSTFAVAKDVLEVSTKPVMISHSNLATATLNHPRLISSEHAKLVASAGGIIGSWPSGIGQTTFADYIDSIQRLIDTVGIEHVAIGTDMDANFKPVFRSYRDWSLIPAALLARGMREADVANIMGENFLRVFKASLSKAVNGGALQSMLPAARLPLRIKAASSYVLSRSRLRDKTGYGPGNFQHGARNGVIDASGCNRLPRKIRGVRQLKHSRRAVWCTRSFAAATAPRVCEVKAGKRYGCRAALAGVRVLAGNGGGCHDGITTAMLR